MNDRRPIYNMLLVFPPVYSAYITCRLGMYTYQFILKVFVLVEGPSIKRYAL